MKKILLLSFSLLISTFLFAADYQIVKVEYNLNPSSWTFLPTTKQFALENNVPVDKNKKFATKEALENYITDYKQRLTNTRAFDDFTVEYTVKESKEINEVTLNITTTDTVHLLAVPYPKYDSNSGAVLKLKAKDYNFLGTMNTMSSDLNIKYDTSDDKNEFSVGFNFDFDYPFQAGIFNATWVNSYSFDYIFGKNVPEWSGKTGLKFELPKNRYSLVFEAYQSAAYELDYSKYDDDFYFNEYLAFSVPVTLGEIPNFSKITTTPSISYSQNWDFDGIDPANTSLSSPNFGFGNTISAGRVNWHDNIRTGLTGSFTTAASYNLQRKMFYPYISSEITAFKAVTMFDSVNFLNRFGICADLYAFYYFTDRDNIYASSDGASIGSRLRGIKDSQDFDGQPELGDCTTTPSAIVLNLDFPYHIFSTNFTKGFLRHFNFDFQISPFFDMAWTYNKSTKKYFDWKDGFYAGGLEVLVYPRKWSSFVVRGSIGYDLGRRLFSDYLNTEWRENVSLREISIGIGLQY